MFHFIVHNMLGVLEKELFLIVTEPMENLEIFWPAQTYHYREYLLISWVIEGGKIAILILVDP